MAITEKRPTTGEYPCTTSIQRLHKRLAYSPGHAQFAYADDLAVATQSTDFAPIEETLISALNGLSE